MRGGTIPAHGAALTHQKQLSHGGWGERRGKEKKKIKENINPTGPYELLKIINALFGSLLSFTFSTQGESRKKGLLSSGSLSAKVHTAQAPQTHNEPGERFERS